MSWYSDGESFDEYDPPWCESCVGGRSKDYCDECCRRHWEEEEHSCIEEGED